MCTYSHSSCFIQLEAESAATSTTLLCGQTDGQGCNLILAQLPIHVCAELCHFFCQGISSVHSMCSKGCCFSNLHEGFQVIWNTQHRADLKQKKKKKRENTVKLHLKQLSVPPASSAFIVKRFCSSGVNAFRAKRASILFELFQINSSQRKTRKALRYVQTSTRQLISSHIVT